MKEKIEEDFEVLKEQVEIPEFLRQKTIEKFRKNEEKIEEHNIEEREMAIVKKRLKIIKTKD